MGKLLALDSALFLSEGTDRKCFRHPDNPDQCIKVLHPQRHPRRMWREARYYRRLRFRQIDWIFLTRYHGAVKTSLGPGTVFDLVRDQNGEVSRSLEHYLQHQDAEFNREAGARLQSLVRNLHDQWVVFHDLNPANILVKRSSADDWRLVAIDGIGHNHFLSILNYSRKLARDKIERVWNKRFPQWYRPYPDAMSQLQAFPRNL